MPNPTSISPDKLFRLIGRADTPHLIDFRIEEDFSADPRLVPGAVRRPLEAVADWIPRLGDRPAVVICAEGHALSEGCAAMLRSLGVTAQIVRGADTARPELAPEAPGLLAASLGLSRMYADDNAQMEAGLLLYDAFYRWCRDATDETHNWPTNRARS
ncbi:chromate resistance protein ChrB domain-containing protein [Roseivivax sp. CAU 1761]